jgi:uncharacterized protein with GYD domain
MPTYVLLQRAEPDAASGILRSHGLGAARQRKAIRALGGRVLAQYAVSGRYDALLILELPDEETSLAVALQLEGEGFYTEVLQAFSPKQVQESLRKLEAFQRPPPRQRRSSQRKPTAARR